MTPHWLPHWLSNWLPHWLSNWLSHWLSSMISMGMFDVTAMHPYVYIHSNCDADGIRALPSFGDFGVTLCSSVDFVPAETSPQW